MLPALRARIDEIAASIQGKPQRPDQWHVTLEFLGQVPHERRHLLQAAADRVRRSPVTIEFDPVEHWRQPQVVCLVASRVPKALAALVTQLQAELAAAGIASEARPFRPRDACTQVRSAADSLLEPPLSWRADGFALVRSVTDPAGSRYEPLHWWNHAVDGGRESGDSGQFFGPPAGRAVE
ncbi:MAG: RNA 2',3'-cyclic phosphodiesterase [Proteobacteria bacterium]|nr:RNA 2',3'-cyclic phosphodiesterase [Pseudomonadota bacterium]